MNARHWAYVLEHGSADEALLEEARLQDWIEAIRDAPTSTDSTGAFLVALPEVPLNQRLTLRKHEAAALLGVSVDWLEDHVLGEIKTIKKGRAVLISRRELDRWRDENEAMALDR